MAAQMENAIFWIDIDKVVPNPYQPRREFEENSMRELADSIKQYGILQPLVVSRFELDKEDGSMEVIYELIAGERRLRASKLIGLTQVPCVIRVGDDSRDKLELAIIENIVRADLNPVEKAMAYRRLAEEFKLTFTDVAKKVSKSREHVSNTVRILMLPQDILDALSKGKITEGHTRPLLMLIDRPDEQMTLFKEMMIRKMTVREAEKIARKIAFEKNRKRDKNMTPDVIDMEENLANALGTRVSIDPKERGGKITIEYFTHDELMQLIRIIKNAGESKTHKGMLDVIRDDDDFNNQIYQTTNTNTQNINNISAAAELKTITYNETEHSLVNFDPNEHSLAINDMPENELNKMQNTNDDNLSADQDDIYNLNKFTI
jgi:ParB family transcriptional regulator, chromosome partitioning protein